MKSIFKLTAVLSLICLIGLLSACKKQNLSELNTDLNNPYQLSFEIAEYEYYVDNLIFEKVKATQIENESLEFKDMSLYPGYFWIGEQTNADSVTLFLSLTYESNLNYTIDYTIDFIFLESFDNLVKIEEGTYEYKDASTLYNQLLNFNESENYINFRSSEYYEMFDDKKFFHQTDFFYMEDETMEITSVLHNQYSNQITIDLNLNAYFKMLSCGYYITHQIKEAKLKGILKI